MSSSGANNQQVNNQHIARLPVGFKRLMFLGVVGALEVMVPLPESLDVHTLLLIVSHPHPLYGGNMHNKVVQTVAKAGQTADMLVLCYNFRGVGASEGEFDHGHGERHDLKAVLMFALEKWGDRAFILAGFSFGAWISAKVSLLNQPKSLLLVAPPVSLYPMESLNIQHISTTIIQGGADEVVDALQVRSWAQKQNADFFWRQVSSHYFHGQLLWLRGVVTVALGV